MSFKTGRELMQQWAEELAEFQGHTLAGRLEIIDQLRGAGYLRNITPDDIGLCRCCAQPWCDDCGDHLSNCCCGRNR